MSTNPSYTEEYLSSNTHSSNDFSSSSQAFESLSSTSSEKPSQALLINIFKNSSLFSSSQSLHMSSSFTKDADKDNYIPKDDTADYFLTSGNFQVYLFICILLVLLLLFFLLVIVILFRCKTICQKRYQGEKGDLYIKII